MNVKSKTVVYKTAGALKIKLDIHWAEHSKGTPVLLFFHGTGSPVQGGRDQVAPHMYNGIRDWNYTLVSADHRLAPQVGIQEIFDDVQDCIKFIRDPLRLSASLPKGTIDPTRLAVSGSGGGSYLALLAGLHIDPKPQAVLAIYPITDPLGSFFTTSHPWDEVFREGMDTKTAESFLKPHLDPKGEVTSHYTASSDGEHPYRHLLYNYALHRGNLAELLHFDSTTNAQLGPANDKWRVAKQIGVSDIPPTFIIHGSADTQVGVEQSDEVVGAAMGVRGPRSFEYKRPGGYNHFFDDPRDNSEDESDEDDGLDHSGRTFYMDLYAYGDQQGGFFPVEYYMNTMYHFMHSHV